MTYNGQRLGRWGWTDFKIPQKDESCKITIYILRRTKHLCPNEPKRIVSVLFLFSVGKKWNNT